MRIVCIRARPGERSAEPGRKEAATDASAFLLQDFVNDLFRELIGVLDSRYELVPHLSREKPLPESRGIRSLKPDINSRAGRYRRMFPSCFADK